mmetsp:Transcript_50870/g.121639  ORF Transcript_50870/g.121639 Transcript_50870/m.121639 type:complete len:495 (-) Transcript_50870:1120-2604(-)
MVGQRRDFLLVGRLVTLGIALRGKGVDNDGGEHIQDDGHHKHGKEEKHEQQVGAAPLHEGLCAVHGPLGEPEAEEQQSVAGRCQSAVLLEKVPKVQSHQERESCHQANVGEHKVEELILGQEDRSGQPAQTLAEAKSFQDSEKNQTHHQGMHIPILLEDDLIGDLPEVGDAPQVRALVDVGQHGEAVLDILSREGAHNPVLVPEEHRVDALVTHRPHRLHRGSAELPNRSDEGNKEDDAHHPLHRHGQGWHASPQDASAVHHLQDLRPEKVRDLLVGGLAGQIHPGDAENVQRHHRQSEQGVPQGQHGKQDQGEEHEENHAAALVAHSAFGEDPQLCLVPACAIWNLSKPHPHAHPHTHIPDAITVPPNEGHLVGGHELLGLAEANQAKVVVPALRVQVASDWPLHGPHVELRPLQELLRGELAIVIAVHDPPQGSPGRPGVALVLWQHFMDHFLGLLLREALRQVSCMSSPKIAQEARHIFGVKATCAIGLAV